MLKLQETKHSYYCDHFDEEVFESLQHFKDDWAGENLMDVDNDYNLVFRYDINKSYDYETDEELGTYELSMNYMLQRKGKHVKVVIRNITDEDLKEINPYLKRNFEYLMGLWSEFNTK